MCYRLIRKAFLTLGGIITASFVTASLAVADDQQPATAPSVPVPTPAHTHIPGSTAIVLPADTTVIVSLVQPLSSSTASVGEVVPIAVEQEVDVDGFVIVQKGADGEATVTEAEHAGGNGHGGKLALTMDWVFAADGGKVQLSNVNHTSGTGDTKGAASTATIVSYALLGPIGLFAHNFVRGKDVTIGTDKQFNMFTDHSVSVDAIQRTAVLSSSVAAPSPQPTQ
jgi:hypothetical protein